MPHSYTVILLTAHLIVCRENSTKVPKSRNFLGAIKALVLFFFHSVCSKVKFPIKLVLAAAEIPPMEARVLTEDCGMFVSAGSVQLEQGVVTEICGHEKCSATYLLREGFFQS